MPPAFSMLIKSVCSTAFFAMALSLSVLSLRAETPAMTDIKVTDFGAIPDDGLDDAPAIQEAIRACRQVENPRLIFPSGVYHLKTPANSKRAFIDVVDFPSITIKGDGAELMGSGLTGVFHFENCDNVQMSGLDIDWEQEELPFAGGRVVAVHDDAIDVEIAPGHPLREVPVQSLQTFDREVLAPQSSSNPDYFLLTQKLYAKPAEIVSKNVLRVFASPSPGILRARQQGRKLPVVGNDVLIWYVLRGGGRAIRVVNCGDLIFEDVRIFAVPDMGLTVNSSKSAILRRCSIMPRPGSGRWLSTTVDGTHFNMIRERVELIDCVFESMGDDGSNVHGIYTTVHERSDARTLVLRGSKNIFEDPKAKAGTFGSPPIHSLRVGETLEFSRNENPLIPTFSAVITEVTRITAGEKKIMVKRVSLDRDLPDYVEEGTIVGNASEAAELIMRNCVVRRNRGMGMRLKTRNALIEGCTFEYMSGAGIWVTCDASVDFESTATRNVVIRNNVIRGAHTAISVTAGRTRQYPDVHQNLRIEGNQIESPWPVAINLQSTKGAVIRNNTIHAPSDDPIRVLLSSDVRIENNVLKRTK